MNGASHVLFAAGRGGDPARHQVMIERLQAAGLVVVAPQFPMLPPGRADRVALEARLATIDAQLSALPADARIMAVGHSIGATLLLAKAGAVLWLGPGDRIETPRDRRLVALALLAPPLGYFAAPGALDGLALPLMLRVGSADMVTPPASCDPFVAMLAGRCSLDFALVEHADHFSFMDERPPGQPEPWAAAAAGRAQLADAVIAFAAAA